MKYTLAILGISAIFLGAFGAHGLKDLLEPTAIQSYKTGVSYHLIHTVAILAMYRSNGSVTAIRLWIIGILLFSGSIYMLTLDELIGVNLNFMGPLTPLGGLFLAAGWGSIAFNAKIHVDKS